jgi:hypothetical protein
MNGYRKSSGLRWRGMWLNGRWYVVSCGYGHSMRRVTYATMKTELRTIFSDDFGNGYAS